MRITEPKNIQKYFECTQETIKKFYNDKMDADFKKEYLPDWEGRKVPPTRNIMGWSYLQFNTPHMSFNKVNRIEIQNLKSL